MAFTTATITHSFQNADGTPASGSVNFALAQRMTNSGTTILPTEVTATLSAQGAISQVLAANTDTGTVPAGAQWRVTLRILGMAPEEFFIVVPSGGGTVDLGTLLPSAEQVG